MVERLRDSALPGAADAAPDRGLVLESEDAAGRQALARDFFERRFRAFAAGTGLMTGYYEPELRGAEYLVGPFQVPLHAPPPPSEEALPDRAAIEAGALEGKGLELAWVDDPVDAFFLHVQGSGRLRLHDGRLLRLGYAGQNGHPYRAVGKPLVDSGAIPREAISMQVIRAWLAGAAPGEAAALLRHNPSYVFFRALEGSGPRRRPSRGAGRAVDAGPVCRGGPGLRPVRRPGLRRNARPAGRRADPPSAARPGHGRRHPGPGARRPVLG
ncbi:MAG: MltA domain-containing protein, partial [Acetobacteraceae bacterium]|nr:MltA domain-containing protein [Acetobacteraceae bacterium]